jgi:hypothetical protein
LKPLVASPSLVVAQHHRARIDQLDGHSERIPAAACDRRQVGRKTATRRMGGQSDQYESSGRRLDCRWYRRGVVSCGSARLPCVESPGRLSYHRRARREALRAARTMFRLVAIQRPTRSPLSMVLRWDTATYCLAVTDAHPRPWQSRGRQQWRSRNVQAPLTGAETRRSTRPSCGSRAAA